MKRNDPAANGGYAAAVFFGRISSAALNPEIISI
jgi:hypothetical protein